MSDVGNSFTSTDFDSKSLKQTSLPLKETSKNSSKVNQSFDKIKQQPKSTRSFSVPSNFLPPSQLNKSFQKVQEVHRKPERGHQLNMGNRQLANSETNEASRIISEEPNKDGETRSIVREVETSGNSPPWSDNVYFKLFLDPSGREAKLMALKCEITYVDIFTDVEHCLYKGRFIGAKTDGVSNLFVFDLMKSHWEVKLPQSQAIELNVDIVMSCSPIHLCAESLLNLLRLEKSYLKHLRFDGQLNVMMRFAHAHGWDIPDDVTRQRVHDGLRNLHGEGVNLEVMGADTIVEEMRVDGIVTPSDEKIAHLTSKRHSWRGANLPDIKPGKSEKKKKTGSFIGVPGESSESDEDFENVSEDDMYYVSLLDKLDQILANGYRTEQQTTSSES